MHSAPNLMHLWQKYRLDEAFAFWLFQVMRYGKQCRHLSVTGITFET